MHVTIRQLKVFDAVATNLSFTKAAEALHLTQPAVSMQIKQLESTVGLALFEVLGKKVFLTEAGHTFLRHTRQILEQLELAARELDLLKGVDGGHLMVTVSPTVNYVVTHWLSRFLRHHGGVRVNLEVADRETLLERLKANQPDIVLMGRPPPDLDVVAQPFTNDAFIVIAPVDHRLLSRNRQVSAKQFAQQRIVLRERGSDTRNAVEAFFSEKQLNMVDQMEMTSNETTKQAVEAGLGLAVVSRYSAELELKSGRLAQLNVQGFPIKTTWYLVHRTGKQLSATAQAFKDFILSEGRAREQKKASFA